MKVYDTLGTTHDITIYFDKGTAANTWEYIITCNPDEDNRTNAKDGLGDPRLGAGMLARGEIIFDASDGQIDPTDEDQFTMERYTGAASTFAAVNNAGDWTAQDPDVAGTLSAGGYYEFTIDFIAGETMTMAFDIGSYYDGTTSWVNDALTTTQYAMNSVTNYQAANGYGAGDLQSVDVGTDGVMSRVSSTGQLLYLNRVGLANFFDIQKLRKEGGNLYKETRESGGAVINHPGTSGLGTISPNTLEQSNVDIAAEFVKMITSQRGFQANSKIISTVDQMLSETISMKR